MEPYTTQTSLRNVLNVSFHAGAGSDFKPIIMTLLSKVKHSHFLVYVISVRSQTVQENQDWTVCLANISASCVCK